MDATAIAFAGVGSVILIAACFFVYKNHAVTTGQALIFAFGVGLIALPHVVDFEWSGKGLKFTTKKATADLNQQVQKISERQKSLIEQFDTLAKAIKETEDQLNLALAKLESKKPSDPFPTLNTLPSQTLNDLLKKNKELNDQSLQTMYSLEKLQQELDPIKPQVQ